MYLVRHDRIPSEASTWSNISFLVRLEFMIIFKIWWQVVLVCIYTTAIVLLNKYFPDVFYMNWSTSLVPILGVVTGLLLVFRTNTSYDRYYEARRLWSLMFRNIRQLTKWVRILIPEAEAKDVIEKKSATNLFLAFAVATKHYLREEYSYEYEDLRKLLPIHKKMFQEPKLQLKKLNSAINYTPPTNIPLEILYYIGMYINTVKLRYKWDPAVSGMMFAASNSLLECLTGFERIKRTPIPLAYTIHLYHGIWLFILALPYQLIKDLGWWTIPAVGLSAFTFIGILEIGSEIEDPFGYDDNDLPLDDLCNVLVMETNEVLGTELPTIEEAFLSSEYFPLSGCELDSKTLSRKSVSEVNTLLHAMHTHPDIAEDPDEDKMEESNVKPELTVKVEQRL